MRTLSIGAAGFAKYTQSGIVLQVGQTATVDVTLQVAAQGEQVVVNSEVPPVEPTRTEVSQVVGTKQIESLPTSSRLFTDFALLSPGVSTGRTSLQSTFTEFEVTRVSFGGMRDLSNEVTVDGADTINTVTGSQRATPPPEAVDEFRVVNNSFGADYGRALGGIVSIVTRSGINSFTDPCTTICKTTMQMRDRCCSPRPSLTPCAKTSSAQRSAAPFAATGHSSS